MLTTSYLFPTPPTVAEILHAIINVLKDALGKLSESACFRDYGRMALVLDEMIYEVRINHIFC